MTDKSTESILAIDCGSVFSKAVLVDKVDGEFRFIAMGEALTTPRNVGEGIEEAVRDIELKTGRRLLQGQSILIPEGADGNGVDAATLACSAASPVRVVAAGITSGQSLPAAVEMATGAMADVVTSVCVEDSRHKERAERKITELQEVQADAVLFASGTGTERNPLLTELSEFIAKAKLVGKSGSKLPVIFAGGSAALGDVSRILGPLMDLRGVGPVSSDSQRNLLVTSILNDLYYEQSILGLPGVKTLTGDNWRSVIASPKTTAVVANFIARQFKTDVALVDLGASISTVAVASKGGESSSETSINCGMGLGAYGAITTAGAENLFLWLPFECEAEQILELGLNKALRPQTVPHLPEDLLVEEAIARAAIKHTARRIEMKSGLLVASGGFFSHLQRHGRVMLLLLDAIQPQGIIDVAYDSLGLIPSLGSVATAFPQAAGEVILRDSLQPLGTAISLVGEGKDGQLAAHVKVSYAGGGEFQIEVPSGGIEVIPLQEGHKANLMVQPALEFHLGANPKGRPVEVEVTGGAVGIVVDARGRPIVLPKESQERIKRLSNWHRALDM